MSGSPEGTQASLLMDTGVAAITLATVNDAVVNVGTSTLRSRFSVILGIRPEVELLGHMAIAFLIFLRNHHALSTEAIPLSIPIKSTREFHDFFLSSLTLVILFICLSVWASHVCRGERSHLLMKRQVRP